MKPPDFESMTISELARAASVPTTTVRYYERAELLMPSSRSGAGYRLYGKASLERLRFIRSAQAVGFALDDVSALLALETDGATLCQTEVAALLEKRLAETEARLRDLKQVKAHLSAALTRCRSSNGECAVMKELSSKQKPRRTKR
jgi:MerR family mercuric resistance operon transcriptional regulator